jgi:hypothetical protein
MEKNFKLHPSLMPNFIRATLGETATMIPVSSLSDKEAEEYGEELKQTFIKHHKQKVKNVKTIRE